jgi:hypothetical protein
MPLGCSEFVMFQKGVQLNGEADNRGDLCIAVEVEGEAGIGRLPPLNTFSSTSGGLSGYSD